MGIQEQRIQSKESRANTEELGKMIVRKPGGLLIQTTKLPNDKGEKKKKRKTRLHMEWFVDPTSQG